MKLIANTYKGLRKLQEILLCGIYTPVAKILFFLNGVTFGKNLSVNGFLQVLVTRRGKVVIGDHLSLNSGDHYNVIGRQQKCIFWVEGTLTIKNNVGMSASAIICNHDVTIGNNVVMGGNIVIYDTDFHSLDATQRNSHKEDRANARWAPVEIKDNVFIGAHSTILKGVTIGENSIVGACSVVSKNIPANEIWGGNPAALIKKIALTSNK